MFIIYGGLVRQRNREKDTYNKFLKYCQHKDIFQYHNGFCYRSSQMDDITREKSLNMGDYFHDSVLTRKKREKKNLLTTSK